MNNHEDDETQSQIPLLNHSSWYLSNTYFHPDEHLPPDHSLLIVFESVRILTCICAVLGVLTNLALVGIIAKTSFRHVSYGLLIIIIALFDSIRLLSAIYYYLLFANVVQISAITETIYLATNRYPIFVVNWCKVLMAIERLLTVRYWEHHTHLDWRSKHKRKQYRRFAYAIIFVLFAGLLSQHPNYLYKRYQSVRINYNRLMIVNKHNENFYYGYHRFNSNLFGIMSYLILDIALPILSVLIVNILLLREIRKLPSSLQIKVKESIAILFFLSFLSMTIIPRALIGYYNYYSSNKDYIVLTRVVIFYYVCLGLEYFNHGITGCACFLSSALLRSELKNMIWTKYMAANVH
ncbi:unnamed protein product [Rotaria sordida]|uniref:G-protein coupled receptors family 1 profile domain-containing protein n=1 Tax=Rotaria sordida TaxID=392033 RepID=A0A815FPX1_9BILA|nr:unnamed protein product [Rotaria sordida]CAF1326666.1 unnamed protein product [Rotaria sordida]CAF3901260.1 unnamed protein product [Rotaria sordida]